MHLCISICLLSNCLTGTVWLYVILRRLVPHNVLEYVGNTLMSSCFIHLPSFLGYLVSNASDFQHGGLISSEVVPISAEARHRCLPAKLAPLAMAWHHWSPTSHGSGTPPPRTPKAEIMKDSERWRELPGTVGTCETPLRNGQILRHRIVRIPKAALLKMPCLPSKMSHSKARCHRCRSTFAEEPFAFRAASAKAPSENLPGASRTETAQNDLGWSRIGQAWASTKASSLPEVGTPRCPNLPHAQQITAAHWLPPARIRVKVQSSSKSRTPSNDCRTWVALGIAALPFPWLSKKYHEVSYDTVI